MCYISYKITATTEEMLRVFASNHIKSFPKILVECSVDMFYIQGPLETLLHQSMQNDWFSFKLQEKWASKFKPRRIFSIFPYKMRFKENL